MIKLSDRYTLTLSCALMLLSLPVLYHFFAAPETVTCRDPDRLVGERLLPSVLEFETVPQHRDLLINGSTGTVELPGQWNRKASYRISRSYDLDSYYFIPVNNFTNMFPEDQIEVRTLHVGGIELPVHLRLDESEQESVLTAYIYILGGRPIRNPFTGSLAQALAHLRHGAHPLTMILLNGRMSFERREAGQQIMLHWIREAWLQYDAICNT
ncbi:MAG: hypothetical protein JRG94_05830 [Deltaproteobacteria bacterium]|nr:hypothetical protein [Deltaproteobacteria bacterium]